VRVHWIGALADSSGYAEASRNYVATAAKTDGIDLSTQTVSFETEHTAHALSGLIQSLHGDGNDAKIRVVHLTPDNYSRFISKDCYNVGYTVWETDLLPHGWVEQCNLMDEIWVPSEWNVRVFKKSGVTVPVHSVPHGFSIPNFDAVAPLNFLDNQFLFYSIFQWTERKNPMSLIKAFLTEFYGTKNVALLLKTYRLNTSDAERAIVRKDIQSIKKSLNLPDLPPIHFVGDLLPTEKMYGLHLRGDCFVLPHRAEGFGIPMAEAMSFGNPVISTGYSGNLEFMNDDNSLLIDYQITPVCNMAWMGHYNGLMSWADPDISHMKKHMRWVYENRTEACEMGLRGKKTIEADFSWEAIGKIMLAHFNRIEKSRS
jgi:glycosyltransferase involved in cell wall biosynthesis